MENIWDKFDKNIDTKALAADTREIEQNAGSGEYEEVPFGTYVVSVEKMELKASKTGRPMLSVWFNVADGECKGRKIFMNQVIEKPFQIHVANEFLRSLDTEFDVEFVNYKQYADLILDIHEEIDKKVVYDLEYGQTSKGFKTFRIDGAYDA